MSFFGDLKISPSLTAAVELFPHAVKNFFFEIRIKYLGILTQFNLAISTNSTSFLYYLDYIPDTHKPNLTTGTVYTFRFQINNDLLFEIT